MITTYRVKITGDKWATEFTVTGGSWSTAIGRALRDWQKKEGRGSRTKEVSVKAFKVGILTE